MTDSDALLHEVNRRAHEVARSTIAWREAYLKYDKDHPETLQALITMLHRAHEYEEAERRAQLEATG